MVMVAGSSVSRPPPPSLSAVLPETTELVTVSVNTPSAVAPGSASGPCCWKAPPHPSAVLPDRVEPSMVTVASSL